MTLDEQGFGRGPASPTLCYKTECLYNGCSGEVKMRAGGWRESCLEGTDSTREREERNVSPTGKRTSMDPTNVKEER